MNGFQIDELELGPVMGRGGQGTVYPVGNVLIDRQWPAVYKEYKREVLRDVDVGALGRVIDVLAQMPPEDAGWLRENSAWPAGLVYRSGEPTGFLMRAIPDEYKLTLPSQDILEKTFDKMQPRPELPNRNGELAWPALLRKLDRIDTSYRN